RTLLPLEGLAARALHAVPRHEGGAAAARGEEARQDGHRSGARGAVPHQVALSAGSQGEGPPSAGLFLVGSSITAGGFSADGRAPAVLRGLACHAVLRECAAPLMAHR